MSDENKDYILPKEFLLHDSSENKTSVLHIGVLGEISKMASVLPHVKYDFLKQPELLKYEGYNHDRRSGVRDGLLHPQ